MKKAISILMVVLLVFAFTATSFATPSFSSLKSDYEAKQNRLLQISTIKDMVGTTGVLQDLAVGVVDKYNKISNDDDYTTADCLEDLQTIAGVLIVTEGGKYTITSSITLTIVHINASNDVKDAKDAMYEHYPTQAEEYFNPTDPGSGGGGADRDF